MGKAKEAFSEANKAADSAGAAEVTSGKMPFIRDDNWKRECLGKTLCAIAFIDGAPAKEGEEPTEKLTSQLGIVEAARAKSLARKDPYAFMWTDGICQEAFADA